MVERDDDCRKESQRECMEWVRNTVGWLVGVNWLCWCVLVSVLDGRVVTVFECRVRLGYQLLLSVQSVFIE
jgi:hypothetical protein